MKLKKMVISILIILTIININSKSYAKYVFEHIEKAAEIRINN